MNKYHIRFNTHHNGSELVWRVFENGVEFLVKDFNIITPVFSECTIENGIQKWNLACFGRMSILNDIAYIQ